MFNKLVSKKAKSRQKIKLKTQIKEVPQDLYMGCPSCNRTIRIDEMESNYFMCPACQHHFRVSASQRVAMTFDRFEELMYDMKTDDPLNFPGYEDKMTSLNDKYGMKDAILTGYASINDIDFIACVLDPFFLMGSMGSVVGEKITQAFERAISLDYPIIIFSTSGGARMQEGLISLMQMAKTSGAVAAHNKKGLLFINVMCDPTTGGVTASFASLADIILAEPKALIGFAGPRVIAQTINSELPEDFQKAEMMLEKGFVDKIVSRRDMKTTLYYLLAMHK
ncbi:acetyl-CoA carboxylase, carboxyltransferase subunit beta [Mycoplasma sp. P36-A1]|uniref:acetyl-CoA carboxylase, carboxyltransferase subunit beta n=1 Tax=Mycoplasma sp. P36-A1 TaxID=3252900 RepID=UPI003C2C9620